MNGVGAVDVVPKPLGQPSKFVCQQLEPGFFIGDRNDMAKLLKSTGDGVNEGIGLETAKESGCIGVSGADERWLLMEALAERVPGRVGRDEMWQCCGYGYTFWPRQKMGWWNCLVAPWE